MNAHQFSSGTVDQPGRDLARHAGHRLSRFLHTAWLWHERARQRRHLQFLSDHMLRDLGLTRCDVDAETAKPFWRA
jgi:uncharacterized protein YjiS (DUF1127 family)